MRFWDWQSDARRTTRWLVLLFGLCVLAALAAVHGGLALAWRLLFAHLDYPKGFVAVNVGVTLFLILGGWWLTHEQLSAGGRQLAQRIGAREARPGSTPAEQQLCNIVQELCVAAQMLPPQVVVLARADAINAFAAGWEPDDAVIAVTQGALDYLTRDEMQGLVAHELSHLKEGDTRLNMQLAGMVSGLELVYHFGETLRERGGLAWWFGNAVMAAGFVGWCSGRLLKAAVARQRELLADARAVQWTRSRDALGGVLRKVMTQRQEAARHRGGWRADHRSHSGLHHPLVQHMLLAETPDSSRLEHWLDAHPPLELRVARIYGRPMRPLPLQATPAVREADGF
ncbi:M48 family metalloprotease [Comamonas aquatica]|jgi:Zn-dependent protease with chaperone function|uniref:M48 family metalloprotease n=1 Tax=Comamonas aquatica TaxID=225991 RepID=A0AA35D8X5_9BURK|nr:M48 family metalloprotease [Comamonas aquatica]MDH0362293.1 M48 family metalloprotease [Comamonas aquatica]MDH1429552.1 M48 family metalloprotease [Comamonas aquatica]MDH1605438.1 M48 family metalloprotease [Comamonas aquatica]MDH1617538.1 M48 family metalloprotease [Comamonas aquatica]MDH1674846.1 M48 family metalloprotease [Comamonas aquatica]